MLTTHNYRTLNPSVMQTPLCQSLRVNTPNYTVCSNSIRISQLVWVDDHYPEKSQLELDLAEDANETYFKKNQLPKHMEFETIFNDPSIKNVIIYDQHLSQYLTLSPAPCMGVINEFNERINKVLKQKNLKEFSDRLFDYAIEEDPDRYYLHGQLVEKFKGSIKLLKYPRDKISVGLGALPTVMDKSYLVVDFEYSDINLDFSGFCSELPSIPLLGSFINSTIEPQLTTQHHLDFAVGLTQWIPPQDNDTKYIDAFTSTGFFKGIMVIDVDSEEEAEQVKQIVDNLSDDLMSNLRNLKFLFTHEIPAANWICFGDNEVVSYLQKNPKADALDAMLSIAQLDRISIVTTGGYAQLSQPRIYPVMPNIKVLRSWAESLYKLTYLSNEAFNTNFLFRANFENEGVYVWEQPHLVS